MLDARYTNVVPDAIRAKRKGLPDQENPKPATGSLDSQPNPILLVVHASGPPVHRLQCGGFEESRADHRLRAAPGELSWVRYRGFVGAGFMPAFKHHQKSFVEVLERGHKARAYKATLINTRIQVFFRAFCRT